MIWTDNNRTFMDKTLLVSKQTKEQQENHFDPNDLYRVSNNGKQNYFYPNTPESFNKSDKVYAMVEYSPTGSLGIKFINHYSVGDMAENAYAQYGIEVNWDQETGEVGNDIEKHPDKYSICPFFGGDVYYIGKDFITNNSVENNKYSDYLHFFGAVIDSDAKFLYHDSKFGLNSTTITGHYGYGYRHDINARTYNPTKVPMVYATTPKFSKPINLIKRISMEAIVGIQTDIPNFDKNKKTNLGIFAMADWGKVNYEYTSPVVAGKYNTPNVFTDKNYFDFYTNNKPDRVIKNDWIGYNSINNTHYFRLKNYVEINQYDKGAIPITPFIAIKGRYGKYGVAKQKFINPDTGEPIYSITDYGCVLQLFDDHNTAAITGCSATLTIPYVWMQYEI